MTFGKQIRHVMLDMGITNRELAKKLDCTPQNVSAILKSENMSESNLVKLMDALECDYELRIIPREKLRTRENS